VKETFTKEELFLPIAWLLFSLLFLVPTFLNPCFSFSPRVSFLQKEKVLVQGSFIFYFSPPIFLFPFSHSLLPLFH